MIDVFAFSGFPVAVFGLGRSGLSAAKALMQSDADVWAWDDDPGAREIARFEGINLVDLYKSDWSLLTTLVLSPGIPHLFPSPHPIAEMAVKANVEIICDIELLGRSQRLANTIGVTGTNGKSTTTALIGHIMQLSGKQAEIGGNLGTPVLDLEALGEGGTYIIEMSSYQLERNFSITFDVAVLLNISPEHLDRHGGMDGYIRAKKLIFHRQTSPRVAVIGVDDPFARGIYDQLCNAGDQNIIPISAKEYVSGGVYVDNGILIDDTENKKDPVCDLREIPSLAGAHNAENAAAAFAACKSVGVAPHAIMACLQSYPGLVHRQEVFEIVDGTIFINDSKATNGDAAARALACYKNIYWIAGGRPKDTMLNACEEYFPNVDHIYLIGEAAISMAEFVKNRLDFTISGDIKNAINQAIKDIKKAGKENAIVLLSPACASFDQFKNFEERGDFFKDIVLSLPGKHLDPFEERGLITNVSQGLYNGGGS